MPVEAPAVPLDEVQQSASGDLGSTSDDDLHRATQNGPTGRNPSRSIAFSKSRGRPISTVIIHHSAVLRAGLAHMLAETQFRVMTQSSSFEHLSRRAFVGEQCLALIGIDDCDRGAILSAISCLKIRDAYVHVIALSEQLRTREMLTCIGAGADGYLLISEITREALLRCLEVVILGGVVIPRGSISLRKDEAAFRYDAPDLTEAVSPSAPVQQSAELARLSNRERTILRELMQGVSNKHIARSLNISEATVKVHVKSLLRKIRVNNRTQAAIWAKSYCPEVSNSEAIVAG